MRRATFTLALAAVLSLSAAELAAQNAVVGTWESTRQGRGGEVTETWTFSMEEGMLKGVASSSQLPEPIEMTGVSFEDGTLTFVVTRAFRGNSFALTYTATIEGDTMTGTLALPGGRGGGGGGGRGAGIPFTATRGG